MHKTGEMIQIPKGVAVKIKKGFDHLSFLFLAVPTGKKQNSLLFMQ